MKSHLLSVAMLVFSIPAISNAAPGGHDFSPQFNACYAAANGGTASKAACLADELDRQNRAAEESHEQTSKLLAGTEKKQFADDFVEWKKNILLDCSLQADNRTVPIERENARKSCLIERTIGRLNGDDLIRQNKTSAK
ncbi:hypothetical protein ACIPF8_05065 [Collimonas sp. NPDC087041]|uniref:hypothetical protein n=1 Tax=Collimonas sp. NPDC087041 TaxID=3363960 RepID=UPI0037FC3700